jgi:hypothetical protein
MTMAMLNGESKVCLTSEAVVLFERLIAYVLSDSSLELRKSEI